MSSFTNPTVVIAPGAWPIVDFFHPLIQAFEERSYPAMCKIGSHLDSQVTETEALTNPDTKYLRENVLLPLVEEGKDIVLLMHSYGGIYGASAVEGLSKRERSNNRKRGGVVALIFVAAFTASKGQSAMDAMGFDPKNPPDWIHHDENTGMVHITKAREMLFHDVPEEEAIRLEKALPRQPYSSFVATLTYDPYSDPWYKDSCGYLFTEADRMLPMVAQEMYAKAAGARTVVLKNSSHSAHIERPAELADKTIALLKQIEQSG
ncbi:hypothetical protein BJ875DRAFT_33154 [Amylocarpus encephaloides]|uniref:AB hydrolase-1 domain-containing protein n=1 Tax=Amylocarpus encephaloides TaxID=45428 RepID=A0A9P7YRR0_9HELO|nr:hypothetical protein BJ875DRAFT_33154 [Amylocarpus encephaloides]